MKYDIVIPAKFISRPNRFIANVEINGEPVTVHVKNTGRCRELLIPGAVVYLSESSNQTRRTKYDLIAVEKGDILINMDSQVANDVAAEWLRRSKLFSTDALIRREVKFGNSRFDFFVEDGNRRAFLEVKGVTLESDGVAMFPDAPTERGIKHINELIRAVSEGYEAYVLFVIQMKGVRYMIPNDATHKAFGDALRRAAAVGVQVLAIDSAVTENSITADKNVPVVMQNTL